VEVTLLVALLLVVQAFFSGLSLGGRAEASERGVLCTTDGGTLSPGRSSNPSDLAHLIDCCTLGCSMVGGQPLPEAAALPLPANLVFAHSGRPAGRGVPIVRAELAPLNTRAPPRSI
jgi:hypothetical protein